MFAHSSLKIRTVLVALLVGSAFSVLAEPAQTQTVPIQFTLKATLGKAPTTKGSVTTYATRSVRIANKDIVSLLAAGLGSNFDNCKLVCRDINHFDEFQIVRSNQVVMDVSDYITNSVKGGVEVGSYNYAKNTGKEGFLAVLETGIGATNTYMIHFYSSGGYSESVGATNKSGRATISTSLKATGFGYGSIAGTNALFSGSFSLSGRTNVVAH
jgi:hypothetical protein